MRFSERTSPPQIEPVSPLPQRQAELVKGEEEDTLRTQAEPHRASAAPSTLDGQIIDSLGGGQPLPQSEREFFEPRFGHDFSRVRIHVDSTAHRLNRHLNSRAFAVGKDLFFRSDKYKVGDFSAKQLLAHELAHVVQQRDTRFVLQRSPDDDEDSLEAVYVSEAEKVERLFRKVAPFPFEGWDDQKKLIDEIFKNLARFIAGLRVLTIPGMRKGRHRYFPSKPGIWKDAAAAGTTASHLISTMRFNALYLGEKGLHEQSNMWINTILWFSGTFLGRQPEPSKQPKQPEQPEQPEQRNFPWLANFYGFVMKEGTFDKLKNKSPHEIRLIFGREKSREFDETL
jgi:hypothetical protein